MRSLSGLLHFLIVLGIFLPASHRVEAGQASAVYLENAPLSAATGSGGSGSGSGGTGQNYITLQAETVSKTWLKPPFEDFLDDWPPEFGTQSTFPPPDHIPTFYKVKKSLNLGDTYGNGDTYTTTQSIITTDPYNWTWQTTNSPTISTTGPPTSIPTGPTATDTSILWTGVVPEDGYRLEDEYTTDQLILDTYQQLTPWTSTLLPATPASASRNLSKDEKTFDLTELHYQFVLPPAQFLPLTINWLVVFKPYDDPTTPADESKDVKVCPMTWTGSGAKTPVFTIDPRSSATLASASPSAISFQGLSAQHGDRQLNGTFTIVPMAFQLRNNADFAKGWDSTANPVWTSMKTSSTNNLVKLSLPGYTGDDNLGLKLAVAQDGGQKRISLSGDTSVNGAETDVNIVSTATSGSARINLIIGSTGQVLISLEVGVLIPQTVRVVIYQDTDPNNPTGTAIGTLTYNAQTIVDKLNEVYENQAQVTFIRVNSTSAIIPITYPYEQNFIPNGIFDDFEYGYNPFPQSTSSLKIYIVRQTQLPHIGLTYVGVGPCVVTSNTFLLTFVHEVGHALGINHEFAPWPLEFGGNEASFMNDVVDSNSNNWFKKNDILEVNKNAAKLYK